MSPGVGSRSPSCRGLTAAPLLALNSDKLPWLVAVAENHDNQLFATWKVQEAPIRILMDFRENRHEVRSVDDVRLNTRFDFPHQAL